MEPDKKQPMNISTSWIQHWPGQDWIRPVYPTANTPFENMDAVHLEILMDDIITKDLTVEDCDQARNMLNNIGIKTQ